MLHALCHLSRKQHLDKADYYPLKKSNKRIERSEPEQANNNEETVWFEPGQRILKTSRRKAHEDLGAVKWRDGYQVKGSEHDIDLSQIEKKRI